MAAPLEEPAAAGEPAGRVTPVPPRTVSSVARVSLIPLTCASCHGVIDPGEKHLCHTDHRSTSPVRFTECGTCARRAGRGVLLGR